MSMTSLFRDKIRRRKKSTRSPTEDVESTPCNHVTPQQSRRKVLRHFWHIGDSNMDQPDDPSVPLTTKTHSTQCADGLVEGARGILSRKFKQPNDARIYMDKRKTLILEERARAWYGPARQSAKEIEIQANDILIKIRENERIDPTLYGNLPSEAVPGEHTRDMGGRFLVNKDRIDRSKVFEIAKEMPKGAHLHLHFNSELQPEVLFSHARAPEMEDAMFIRSTRALRTPEDFALSEIVFNVQDFRKTKLGNLFAEDYDPDFRSKGNSAWMRWVDFRHRFPADSRISIEHAPSEGEELDRAERWAREKMIVTMDHAYNERQTTNGAWACFNQGTRAFKGLVNHEGVYRWYIGHAIDSMIHDKVMYAELRPMLLDKKIPRGDGVGFLDHQAQMDIVCHEVQRKKVYLGERNELHLFPFGLKIIYCTPRSITREMMAKELQDCLKLKLQFPDLICGFDLVGAEDRHHHIGYYADLLVAFADTCRELNVDVPFMFHAGETRLDTGGSHNPDNSNLYDALLLNSKRIGHGYALLRHPTLVEQYREKKICLELCPISNELLHLCGDAKQHIFPELLATGLHCTLNADNPSLNRGAAAHSRSLSYEFYQVMVGDPGMNMHGWKQLAQWSIEHACLDVHQRAEAMGIFDRAWHRFCEKVVEDYDAYAATLQDLDCRRIEL